MDSIRGEISPSNALAENVIRTTLTQILPGSVHVLLESALLLQFADETDGLVRGARAELGDDIDSARSTSLAMRLASPQI